MNRQEAEQLAECIRTEAGKQIAVLGIKPFGPGNPSYASDYFVNCACKMTGLRFVVKSSEHWENLKQHVIVRLCRAVYRLIKKAL
jgi:hypothetical protein